MNAPSACTAPRRTPTDHVGFLEAIEALGAGLPVLLTDLTGDRGYLLCLAECVPAEFFAYSAEHGRGVTKVAMEAERLTELGCPVSGPGAQRLHSSVDLRGAERPGSLEDRQTTLRALADPATTSADLVDPGHVFPVEAGLCTTPDGACVVRAMVTAARLAGGRPVVAYSDVVDERGGYADAATTDRLAVRLGLHTLTLASVLIEAERANPSVNRVVQADIPTPPGLLTAVGYLGRRSEAEYVAFRAGPSTAAMRVHVHRRCQLSDIFGGAPCGCGEQLREALREIQGAAGGIVLYHGDTTLHECPRSVEATHDARWVTTVEIGAIMGELGVERARLSANEALLTGVLERIGLDICVD